MILYLLTIASLLAKTFTPIDSFPCVPQTVEIPAINLQAQVLPVDLNEERKVSVPEREIGWFVKGAKPGEKGTATFQGHFQVNSLPGVFNKLADLKIGDLIKVSDIEGNQFQYRVYGLDLVDTSKFPIKNFYGQSNKSRLNLVTCAGNYSAGDYDKRTIIYSELIN